MCSIEAGAKEPTLQIWIKIRVLVGKLPWIGAQFMVCETLVVDLASLLELALSEKHVQQG